MDATFYGGYNDTIGGRVRLSTAGDIADLSPSTLSDPWQLPTFVASLVLVTGNEFVAGVIVTGDKFIIGINNSGDH